jgi:hypothetical protein
MMPRIATRAAGVCAIAGSAALFVGTALHPMGADPNQVAAAFAEYAADPLWVASHLTQLAGFALMVSALVVLAHQLLSGPAAAWSGIAATASAVSLAIAAMLQAVDGIALKNMVDAWAAAPAEQKDGLFQAAFAVRQIEIGLASMLGLSMGLTATLFGLAILFDRTYPRWVGGIAIFGCIPTMVGGLLVAYTGFSAAAMATNLSANALLLVWMIALGSCMWRHRGLPAQEPC